MVAKWQILDMILANVLQTDLDQEAKKKRKRKVFWPTCQLGKYFAWWHILQIWEAFHLLRQIHFYLTGTVASESSHRPELELIHFLAGALSSWLEVSAQRRPSPGQALEHLPLLKTVRGSDRWATTVWGHELQLGWATFLHRRLCPGGKSEPVSWGEVEGL